LSALLLASIANTTADSGFVVFATGSPGVKPADKRQGRCR